MCEREREYVGVCVRERVCVYVCVRARASVGLPRWVHAKTDLALVPAPGPIILSLLYVCFPSSKLGAYKTVRTRYTRLIFGFIVFGGRQMREALHLQGMFRDTSGIVGLWVSGFEFRCSSFGVHASGFGCWSQSGVRGDRFCLWKWIGPLL